jgi:hypothetical protein
MINKTYIDAAFEGDEEILDYFDPAYPVTSVQEVCDNIYQKLVANYNESSFEPLDYEGIKVGFLCYTPGVLVSFGVNKAYRNKEILELVWSRIKDLLGDEFAMMLYDRNSRAIKWLTKCGMKVLGEHVTILVHSKN